ncbi:hypothetical protein HGRIS_012955 [Hohenbuehelia grisea]|uniref:AAA+ ATPase domain-containing protein n=1 Tax=Hohenbuehelia grisea TaxID=104357 RepID=A0ABR3ITY4_9AGAR
MFALAANGLLGSSEPSSSSLAQEPAASPMAISESLTLVSNGLLGSLSSADDSTTHSLSEFLAGSPDITGNTAARLPSPKFVENGLLSGPQKASELGDSRDYTQEELPPPSTPDRLLVASSASSAGSYTSRLTIPARTFDGKTVYIRRKSKPLTSLPSAASRSSSTLKLLEMPIHRMMHDLSLETAKRLNERDIAPAATSRSDKSATEEALWVDRYRPRRYIELVGNERVSRDVLSWVKLWDWCVFGKRKGKKKDADPELVDDDDYRRPRQKLLLISGPPGLGKTTLAHVVAQQAGYEVLEINASDARSAQVVDDRIRPALEAGSTLLNSKPVLIIIDEIDGVSGSGDSTGNFIHKLVQLTYDKPGKKNTNGKKRDVKRPLLRPIICICNDPNGSSLAKLRLNAHHIRLNRPSDVHTVKRLREICSVECLKAETRALTALAGIAKGDLRGCLNTLQFIKSRNETVTEAVVRRATQGMKEAESTMSSVLNSIFNPLSKKRANELALTEAEESKYVNRLCREIQIVDRNDRVATGCFAHYMTLHQQDANFSRYEQAGEWLCIFDCLSNHIYMDQEFGLKQYAEYSIVPFHHLFQARGNPKVERSDEDWLNYQTTIANTEIYKSLAQCLRIASCRLGGAYKQFMATPSLEVEFAPYINRIISPPLRPVNSQVIRPAERALLSRLVDIMASLDLHFVQERAEDGQLSYRLDPPIDVFINYDGKRAADITVTRYATRHLVAGEIDARVASQKVTVVEKDNKTRSSGFFGNAKRPVPEDDSSPEKENAGPAPVAKRAKTDMTVDIADKPPVDFFGRPIDVSTKKVKGMVIKKPVLPKFRISYKFAEGNSAAVRKPVKMDSFL